jgi:hypothetical protein
MPSLIVNALGGQDALCRTEGYAIQRAVKSVRSDFRKYKAGLATAEQQLSAQKLQEIHDRAAQWGKIVARRACGEPGPGPQLDFRPWSKSPPPPLRA